MSDLDRPRYSFTLESLAAGGRDLEQVEKWFEDYACDETLFSRGFTWNDLLDRLERAPWYGPDGPVDLDLPASLDDPVYRRLLTIGKRVRRESLNG